MTTKVFIDPDGTLQREFGLLVLVRRSTGVSYSIQCNGVATHERSAEGFLVPVGGPSHAIPLLDWFSKQIPHVENWSVNDWTKERIDSLASVVGQIPIWNRQDDNDLRTFLRLDYSRIAECVEAWIPVGTPFGPGYLLTANSD